MDEYTVVYPHNGETLYKIFNSEKEFLEFYNDDLPENCDFYIMCEKHRPIKIKIHLAIIGEE